MWVVDQTGVIVAHELTDATVDDAATGVELIEAVGDDIASVTADAAYDTVAFYDAAGARGATVVVPPAKTARVSRRRPRSRARDRTITKVKSIGRRRWKKTSRYHQQARVENAFFRYKSIIGDGLRARTPGGRTVEAVVACNVLNAMTAMGCRRRGAECGGGDAACRGASVPAAVTFGSDPGVHDVPMRGAEVEHDSRRRPDLLGAVAVDRSHGGSAPASVVGRTSWRLGEHTSKSPLSARILEPRKPKNPGEWPSRRCKTRSTRGTVRAFWRRGLLYIWTGRAFGRVPLVTGEVV